MKPENSDISQASLGERVAKGSLGDGVVRLASKLVWAFFWIGPVVS